jgi:hypothetical protein
MKALNNLKADLKDESALKKIDEIVKEYSDQIDTLEYLNETMDDEDSAFQEWRNQLYQSYFVDKANLAINKIIKDLKDIGVEDDLLELYESAYHKDMSETFI